MRWSVPPRMRPIRSCATTATIRPPPRRWASCLPISPSRHRCRSNSCCCAWAVAMTRWTSRFAAFWPRGVVDGDRRTAPDPLLGFNFLVSFMTASRPPARAGAVSCSASPVAQASAGFQKSPASKPRWRWRITRPAVSTPARCIFRPDQMGQSGVQARCDRAAHIPIRRTSGPGCRAVWTGKASARMAPSRCWMNPVRPQMVWSWRRGLPREMDRRDAERATKPGRHRNAGNRARGADLITTGGSDRYLGRRHRRRHRFGLLGRQPWRSPTLS